MDSRIKLLRYPDHVKGVIDGDFKPPIMCDVDVVSGMCNLDCVWCAQAKTRKSEKPTFMSIETMMELGPFCREWGVKSWRIAGDSEPTLNGDLYTLLESGDFYGISMGLITNGVLLDTVKFLDYLAWIGISLDAIDRDTWAKLKNSSPNDFDKTINNIKRVRQECPDLDITLKFVNWVGGLHLGNPKGFNLVCEDEVSSLAEDLGCSYIIRDAMPKNPEYRFEKCRATPLYGTFGADKKFYICCDRRDGLYLTDDYTRDAWAELPRLWDSAHHKELLAKIEGCTFCSKEWLNCILENIVMDGKLSKEFQVEFI